SDRRGDSHLVAVVDDLAGGLGGVVGGDQRQQLLAGLLGGQHLAGDGRDLAGQLGQAAVQPLADGADVGRAAQVLGQLAGQVDDRRGHYGGRPADGGHGTVVGGPDAGGGLPGTG